MKLGSASKIVAILPVLVVCLGSGVLRPSTITAGARVDPSGSPPTDWATLWQPADVVMPAPVTRRIRAGELGGMGDDLEGRDWLVVSTTHHQLCFQASAGPTKVEQVYRLLDRIYAFLSSRSPARLSAPIRAFLVPGERGHSRCSQSVSAMRTGDEGELQFVVTSLLHEETRLFNFAFLDGRPQGWWCGEFSCLYFQERALLERDHADVRKVLGGRLPAGPTGPLAELDRRGKDAFDEAVAAMYFLEETYGTARLNAFRQLCLARAKAVRGGEVTEPLFRQAFGKDSAMLDREWRAFFGWPHSGDITRPVGQRPPE